MDKPTLIQKIKSLEGLTSEERADLIELINTKKKYGLVWEDKPEDVEEQLRSQLPVLIEVPERRILAKELPQAVITSEQSITEEPTLFDETETSEIAMAPSSKIKNSASLLLSGEGARRADEVEEGRGEVAPNHILIEGDNLHALTALSFTHEGKIDVIYIDPPYNTGNKDFKYNDSFVDREDTYRHSKWLSFMHKRLQISKKLLSDKGVIFISIDDNEQAQLKILCDEIFGEKDFIGVLIWEKKKKGSFLNNSITNIKEYIYIYIKNQVFFNGLTAQIVSDTETYPCINPGNAISLRTIPKGIKSNFSEKNYFLESGNIISAGNMSIKLHSDLLIEDGKLSEDVILESEWRYSQDSLRTYAENGELYLTNQLYLRRIVNELRYKKLKDILPRIDYDKLIELQKDLISLQKTSNRDYTEISKLELEIKSLEENLTKINLKDLYFGGWGSNEDGDEELRILLGKKLFDFPKPVKLLEKLLASVYNESATILDFFAGSGTTLHATMQLNTDDGGNRQCILVTNNENNIAEEVCYERNKRVIQGYTNAKGVQVPGLTNNNLRYYKSEFVPSVKNEQNKRLLTHASTDLLCIKENCYEDITAAQGFNAAHCRIFTNNTGKYMVVVYHSRNQFNVIEQLIVFIQSLENLSDKVKLYAFSPEKETLLEDFYEVADLIDAVPLPEAIYNAYRATFRTLKLDKKPVSTLESTEALTDTSESEIAFPTLDEA
jgi:adenine-specific DNA-methyltransferase